MKKLIVILTLLIAAVACKKDDIICPKPEVKIPIGEKVIFYGPNPECEGAMIFELQNGTFIRTSDYPEIVKSLKKGDVVYLEYIIIKSKTDTGEILGTPVVVVKKATLENSASTQRNSITM